MRGGLKDMGTNKFWRCMVRQITHRGHKRRSLGDGGSASLLPPVVVPIISFGNEKPEFSLDSPQKWDAALLHFTNLIHRHGLRINQLLGDGVAKRSKDLDEELAKEYHQARVRLNRLEDLQGVLLRIESDRDTVALTTALEQLAQRLKLIIARAAQHLK